MNSIRGFSSRKIFIIFIIMWGLLNLMQAFLTPLHNDEAYYWMFSRYPAWGYYDHPPMIAMMIHAGYFLFKNELGVRLLVILAQLLTMFVVWQLIAKEKRIIPANTLLLVLIMAILPVLTMYGFLATPDSPLILFAALVLYQYKKFLEKESWGNTFLLGLTMACLMYSKYHGGLMVILLVFSNLRLLLSVRFIISTLFALFLFSPHVLWQVNNNFPSFQYHLIDRVSGFDLAQVPEYLMNLILIHNPFIFMVFVWAMLRIRAKDKFERSLIFIILGFIIFFFISSFRYHVEPQWTALITIPLLILLFNDDFIYGRSRYLRKVFVFMFPLFLFARVALMYDFLPVTFLKEEFHQHRGWAKDIEKIAQGKPVVFSNAYQDPSLYSFYTGGFAHSLNNKDYRKTQFDLWDFEEKLHDREVCYIPHWLDAYYKSNLTPYPLAETDTVWYRFYRNFQSLQRKCVILEKKDYLFSNSVQNIIDLIIFNPYPYPLNFNHPELPVLFQAAFIRDGVLQVKKNLQLPDTITGISPGGKISFSSTFMADDLPEGEYTLTIAVEVGILFDTYSSEFRKAVISH